MLSKSNDTTIHEKKYSKIQKLNFSSLIKKEVLNNLQVVE